MQVFCYTLPSKCILSELPGSLVVIDVLRATTTISFALANGANSVHPFAEIELARDYAHKFPSGEVLLGGERQGEKVDGFDLGNSPLEYSPSIVRNRSVAFTTTNGTRAMECCRAANDVVMGAFCNLDAVVNYFAGVDQLGIICAGTNGEISVEDCAFAGAVVDNLGGLECAANGDAKYCLELWHEGQHELAQFLRSGSGGKNLIRLNREADIDLAASVNTLDIIPKLDVANWKIEPA